MKWIMHSAKRHIKVPIKPMKNYILSIYFVGELDPDSEATHKILELLRRKVNARFLHIYHIPR